MQLFYIRSNSLSLLLAAVLVMALVGCPTPKDTSLTTLFSGGSTALKANVALEDIESLTVAITMISLDRAGSDSGEGEGEGEENKVVVFEGEMDVNIKELQGVSEILSSQEVPAGKYTKVRLSIANPRLVLVSDPQTEITDIQLTANSRLFVSEQFELPEDEPSLLILDFGGLHLVAQGNGGYTLTPQLQVTIDITSAASQVTGTITAVDETAGTVTIALEEGTIEIVLADAPIFLPEDSDTPNGTTADLTVGTEVDVTGTVAVDGTVTATQIVILSPAEG